MVNVMICFVFNPLMPEDIIDKRLDTFEDNFRFKYKLTKYLMVSCDFGLGQSFIVTYFQKNKDITKIDLASFPFRLRWVEE